MISIEKNKVEKIIQLHKVELDEFQQKSLLKLKKFGKENSLNQESRNFLNAILKEFSKENFLTVDNSNFSEIVRKIGVVPKYQKKFHNKSKISSFKDEILNALNYKGLRGSFFPTCFKQLDIKACVYCNSQLTLSVEKLDGEISAKFQLDHYYPKDQYPYLSIAFFNLYPVCASCNLSKSNNLINFVLYDDSLIDKFNFEIEKESVVKFLLSRDVKDLKIKFTGDSVFERVFSINAIYDTQKDIAEEVITKHLIYNDSYRKDLKYKFSKNKISDSLINRYILGNYVEKSEIHKRPMSKFMQDIGKDIGLI